MQVVRLHGMNRIADAAAAQLARCVSDETPVTAEEILRLLARIARTGPPAARLRALELLGERIWACPAVSPQRGR